MEPFGDEVSERSTKTVPTGSGRPSISPSRRRGGWVVPIGIGLSVIAHVAVLNLSLDLLPPMSEGAPDRSADPSRTFSAIEVVRLNPVDAPIEDPVEPDVPVSVVEEVPEPPQPAEPTPSRPVESSLPESDAGGDSRAPSAAERLRVGAGPDRRFLPPATERERTPAEEIRSSLRMGIRELSDSLASAREAEERGAGFEGDGRTTWTGGDSTTGAWGLSPGNLHLGGTVVPLCSPGSRGAIDCGFGVAPGRREELMRRLGTQRAIEQQVFRRQLEERIRVMREQARIRRDTVPDRRRPDR